MPMPARVGAFRPGFYPLDSEPQTPHQAAVVTVRIQINTSQDLVLPPFIGTQIVEIHGESPFPHISDGTASCVPELLFELSEFQPVRGDAVL